MLRLVLILTSAALLPLPALAAHPLASDDTGTQGDRHYALELSGGITSDRADGALTQGGAAALILSMGTGPNVDLVFGLPGAWSRTSAGDTLLDESVGAADATIELKWRFLELGGFSLALKPGLSLPTGDPGSGLGAGSMGYALTLIASQTFGPTTLHFNVGACHNDHALVEDRATTRHDTLHASAAAAVAVTPSVQLVANVGLQSPATVDAGSWPAFLVAGAIYAVGDSLTLDAGVRTALDDADTDLALLAGASYRF